MNFINITCIHGNSGAGENCTFSRLQVRAIDSVVELTAISKARALVASKCQPSRLSVFVDWSGDPLGVRVSSTSFMERNTSFPPSR